MAGRIRKVPLALKIRNYTINTYGKARRDLMKCFQRRCGYSMIHCDHLGGEKEMEVDHFDPRSKRLRQQKYKHFVLSSGHCNRSKGATFHTAAQKGKGVYLINPRQERDYGIHLSLNSETGSLKGETAAGKYQIRICDLNAPSFCKLRRDAERARKLLKNTAVKIKPEVNDENFSNLMKTLRSQSKIFPKF